MAALCGVLALCFRSSLRCAANVTVSVPEPCLLRYALVPAAAYAALPDAANATLSGAGLFAGIGGVEVTEVAMLALQPSVLTEGELDYPITINPTAGDASSTRGGLSQVLQLASLADQTPLLLLLVAKDSSGNINLLPFNLNITTPDIRPPSVSASAAGITGFALSVSVGLSESGTVWYVVVPYPSTAPAVDQVGAHRHTPHQRHIADLRSPGSAWSTLERRSRTGG